MENSVSESDIILIKFAFNILNMKVIYDSNCNFCNKTANYLKKRDLKNKIHWICRESKESSKLFKKHSIDEQIDSIITLTENNYFIKSEAVFLIFKKLNLKYYLFFKIIPNALKNYIYDFIAKNRYLFNSCSVHKQ